MTSGRIVVFDLDGTLVDTAPDLINALNFVLDREGLPPVPLDSARNMIGAGARRLIERGLELEGRFASVEDITRLTGDFIDYYAAHIADVSRPFEGLETALDDLQAQGYRFAVCTNKLEWLSKLLLDQLGLSLPEEMPVNEVVEAAYALEDRIGISLGPVIVNACLPADPGLERDPEEAASEVDVTLTGDQVSALRSAAEFRARRFTLQEEQRARLAAELPLPQLQAPFLFSAGIGPDELDELAGELAAAIRRLPDDTAPSVHPRPEPGVGTATGGEATR